MLSEESVAQSRDDQSVNSPERVGASDLEAREDSVATHAAATSRRMQPRTPRKRFRRFVATWSRWLHIYLSMFGAATILFFSVTGLTLNHPDWFFEERLTTLTAEMNDQWLNLDVPAPEDWDEYDFSHRVAKLEVAEHLRSEHHLRGHVTDFLAFEDECEVTFQSPGYSATARINRASGEYSVDLVTSDLVTVLNDLHKGRHSGKAWSWVIDLSAILGVVVSLSGFILIFFLKLKRLSGIVTAVLGTLILWAFYVVATS